MTMGTFLWRFTKLLVYGLLISAGFKVIIETVDSAQTNYWLLTGGDSIWIVIRVLVGLLGIIAAGNQAAKLLDKGDKPEKGE